MQKKAAETFKLDSSVKDDGESDEIFGLLIFG